MTVPARARARRRRDVCVTVAAFAVTALLFAALLQVMAAVSAPAGADDGSSEITVAEARSTAEKTGRPVEVTALRRESLDVKIRPDGTFSAKQYLLPVRTRKNGRWVGIDTRLTEQGDVVSPKATKPDLVFSAGGTGPLVRMSRAGRELSLTWPGGALPVPAIEGDTARYAEVRPGVDLLLRADADGFAHTFVVKTAAAAAALGDLRLKITAPGLSVRTESTGSLVATEVGTGAEVFEAPAPLMWDSSPSAPAARKRSAAGPRDLRVAPGEGAKRRPVRVGVSHGEMTLVPDQELLDAPDTTFPVFIDPRWKTPRAAASLMVSNGGWSSYNFRGNEGVGLCEPTKDPDCGTRHKKRLFFRMPMSAFAGKHVISAEFIAFETHAYNCNNSTSVQLWHASGFGRNSTWNSTSDNWKRHLTSRDVAYCSRTPVEFGGGDLLSVVRGAASRGDPALTFGLKAYSESSMAWWKRFAADAYLRVHYNAPPSQPRMSNLSMNPGGPCVDWTDPPAVNRLPTMYAILTDPDGDKVQAEFRVTWDDGSWTSSRIGPKASGQTFQVTAPSSIPQGKVLHWHVRAWDGYQWSPWSWGGGATSCYFSYDPNAPAPPVVSSADYPASDPEDPDDPWYDGVGRYGQFTLQAADADVNRYWVGVNTTPSAAGEHRPTAPGGSVTVQVAPTRAGVNFLYVKALDAAGNTSASTTYLFRVKAGSPATAHWKLDEAAGSTTLADSEGSADLTAHGGTTLGTDGQAGTAMRLDGSGYAATGGKVIDTTRSFAVSAWAKLSSKVNTAVIVGQEGSRGSAFALYYSPGYQRWVFNMQTPDSDTPTLVRAVSKADADLGRWTHLTGVYDHIAQHVTLYVNGSLQQRTAQPYTFDGDGRLNIGRFKYQGGYGSEFYYPGALDDIRVYDRVVTADEVGDLQSRHPVPAGRWKLNTGGADDSGLGRDLTMGGNAHVDQSAGWVGDPMGGLVLDGDGDHAATARPVVSTAQSFTVAGWATSAGPPGAKAAVFSQAGDVNSGFTVRYDPAASGGAGGWQIEMPAGDAAGAAMQTADHSAFQSLFEWDHVAIVYDSFSDVMRLYVNGWLEETETEVSVRWNTIGFDASGPLQLGRSKTGGTWGEYWPGVIDDVWAFTGTLNQQQIQKLADGTAELPSDTPL